MITEIKKITAKELQSFNTGFQGEKTFLQSGTYGQWRESIGEEIIYLGIFQTQSNTSQKPKADLIGTALLQKIKSRFKTYLHCPHGPLIDQGDEIIWKEFLTFYKELGKKEKCDLIRISPLERDMILTQTEEPKTNPFKKTLKSEKFIPAAIHLINPELTWVLDIDRPLDDILKTMKKSTRYEVKRIEKCGINVTHGNSEKDLDVFWELHSETVKRQGFVPFPRSQTEAQLKTFGDSCLIFNASIEQEYYSSSVIIFDNHSAYYHQGASKYSKLPCSHATLYEAIKIAQAKGCKEFNFWGVSPEENKKHPWYGLSKFKRGFGGVESEYIHIHDFEITPKAKINRLIEAYRKKKRKY